VNVANPFLEFDALKAEIPMPSMMDTIPNFMNKQEAISWMPVLSSAVLRKIYKST
jgi:hypothetical protein